jgi:uncharacterized membrane protein YidH (DUF202 family)
LIGIAAILLGLSFWQMYRGERACRRKSPLSLILVGLSALIVLGVIIFSQQIAALMAGLP